MNDNEVINMIKTLIEIIELSDDKKSSLKQLEAEYKNILSQQDEEIFMLRERRMSAIDEFKNKDVDKKEFVEEFFELMKLFEQINDDAVKNIYEDKQRKISEKFFNGMVKISGSFDENDNKSVVSSDLYNEAIKNADAFYNEFLDYLKREVECTTYIFLSYRESKKNHCVLANDDVLELLGKRRNFFTLIIYVDFLKNEFHDIKGKYREKREKIKKQIGDIFGKVIGGIMAGRIERGYDICKD